MSLVDCFRALSDIIILIIERTGQSRPCTTSTTVHFEHPCVRACVCVADWCCQFFCCYFADKPTATSPHPLAGIQDLRT